MPVFDELGVQIDHSYVESVNTNAFIADNYGTFLPLCNWANFRHDGHVTVTDIQLGVPINKILIDLSIRIININLDKKVTEPNVLLVGEEVEKVAITNDVLNGSDFLFVIVVYFKFLFLVDEEDILG